MGTTISSTRRTRLWLYFAIIVGSLAISLDFASIDLAVSAIEKTFGLTFSGVQWVINGYVMAFSVLMVAGGRFADAYGRKQIFLAGMVIFALASLGGGFAWNGASVIGFRVLQGVGAAMLWPAMIGLGCQIVGDDRRGFVLGIIFGTCSLGNAAGPVIGGALTEWFSWRWVLWINVPMATAAIAVMALSVESDKPTGPRPANDWLGMGLLTGGLVLLMLTVYQVPEWGWRDWRILAGAAMALGMLVIFPFIEGRVRDPLVPVELMRSPEFLTLCYCTMAICNLFFLVLLYFTQYAMKFLGDDPISAGARVIGFMLVYGAISFWGGTLYEKLDARRLLIVGLVSGSGAAFLLAVIGPGAVWWAFHGSLMLLGVGVGAVIPTVSTRAIETAGTERASLASGIQFMCQLSGAALLLAVGTAIFIMVGTAQLDKEIALDGIVLTPAQSAVAASVLEGAQRSTLIHTSSARVDEMVISAVDAAYRSGLAAAMTLAGVLVVVALILVLRFVPASEKHPSPGS